MRIHFVFHKIFNNNLLTFKSALNFSWTVELTSKNRINLGLPPSTGLVEKVTMSVLNCSYAPMSTRTLLEPMVKARIYNSLTSSQIQWGSLFCKEGLFCTGLDPWNNQISCPYYALRIQIKKSQILDV